VGVPTMKWALLTARDLAAVSRELPVIMNIAAIEQHGPHLPVATDSLVGAHFIDRLDERLQDDVLIVPQVRVCCSAHHMDFAGTLTVRHETLMSYVLDILDSIAAHGFRKIVLFNSHGGNEAIGRVILEKWGAAHPLARMFMLTWWRIAARELAAVQESGFGGIGHACEFETSLVQYFAPHLVTGDQIREARLQPTFAWAESDMLNAPCGVLYRSMKEMSCGTGVAGQPIFASAAKGKRISDLVTQQLVSMVRDIRDAPTPAAPG
jgi:creatinine amidohydrolase